MRQPFIAGLASFVLFAAIAMFVPAAAAQGIQIEPGGPYLSLTNCPFIGNDAGTAFTGSLAEGRYIFRTTGDDVAVCVAAPDAGAQTCTSGGEPWAMGTVFRWSVPRGGVKVGCRSLASDAGDAIWSRGE